MNMEDKLIYYYTGLGWNDDPCDAETRIAVVTTGFGCAICGPYPLRKSKNGRRTNFCHCGFARQG
ncbi:hypothetical protein DFP98_122104 [Cohnella phaseoli]|uniref:Uncharacterized protein n=1 Tax=Cohnella phaseoli TaxID=456490 RepID=A0A3D9IRW6_9BACL|nr:hypothetical protein DFP98_122104 [Cohnella phaseoli]